MCHQKLQRHRLWSLLVLTGGISRPDEVDQRVVKRVMYVHLRPRSTRGRQRVRSIALVDAYAVQSGPKQVSIADEESRFGALDEMGVSRILCKRVVV